MMIQNNSAFSNRMAILSLVSITLVLFFRVCFFEFLSFDDDIYVSQNPFIRQGITVDSLQWAMTAGMTHFSIHAEYWQPLTLISRMLDVQFFGLNAGGHHFTNLMLHLANVLLLYFFLLRVVKERVFSFFVALLFAIHPLQVEVVAWVTSRKDVLSVFFALLCLHAYALWVESKQRKFYGFAFLFFLCSVMTKPMMVTLPALLLCLDFWPLQRITQPRDLIKQIFTKIPFWVVVLFAIWIPFIPHLTNISQVQYASREVMFSNIFKAYGLQAYRFFIPIGFSIYQSQIIGLQFSWPWIIGVGGVYATLLATCFHWRRKVPFLLMGVFWFFIALSPVVSLQFISNRFMYFPIVGVAIFTVSFFYFIRFGETFTKVLRFLTVIYLFLLSFVTWQQVSYWQNDETLFSRAMAVDSANTKAFYILGKNAMNRKDWISAIYYYEGAVNVLTRKTALSHAHFLLAQAYHSNGQTEESRFHFEKAFKLTESPIP
jgi:hypothetical protein